MMPMTEETQQITVPLITKRALKIRVAEAGDPMRVILLRALAATSNQARLKEIQDRRKAR